MKNARKNTGYRPYAYALLSILVVWWSWGFTFSDSTYANPGINEQINFQGRLFTSEGATVSDGFYNVQFRIYAGGDGQQAGNPGGTLLWEEDHLNDNDQGVTVRNGFLSVSLGSINSFGSAVDWNNDTLWLSINVAGTGESCSSFNDCNPDGEMLPMKRLTAAPYSLNSGMLGGIPSGGFVQLGQGVQTDASSVSSIHIDKTGSGDFLQLQANGSDVFRLSGSGDIEFGGSSDHTISVAEADSGDGRSLTVSAGGAATGSDMDGGDLVLRGGSGDGSGVNGAVRVSSSDFQVVDSSDNSLFNIDTQNAQASFGSAAEEVDLTTYGTLAVTTLGAQDNDTIICHNSANQLASCSSDFASESYVTLQNAYENGNAIQTNAAAGDVAVNLANDTADPNFLVNIEDGSSGRFAVQDDGVDVLGVTSSSVSVNGDFMAVGTTVSRAGEDGDGVFQLQNSLGATLFSMDTNQDENVVANSGAEDTGSFGSDWAAFDGAGSATVTRNDTDTTNIASGSASVAVDTTDAADVGARNHLAANPQTDTTYIVSFSARLGSGPAFNDIEVGYSYDGGTNITTCDTNSYNTRELIDTEWRKITCVITTPSDSVTDPNLIIRQPSAPGGGRTFYLDNVSMVAQNASGGQSTNTIRVGGSSSQGLTLFTLDTYADTPFTGEDAAFAGSMYFDTSQGSIQCYDGSAWTACGATPDSSVTLTPEYAGATLNGGDPSGVGVMTADFCSNDAALNVGDLCEPGESRNFYQWTSPQASMQEYQLYVRHKLPPTFESFADSNTIRLTWLTDSENGEDGTVSYQVFREASGGGVTSCDGTNESTEVNPSANTWYTTTFAGDELACGFTGNDSVIFKINVSARNNANVYVEDIEFTYSHQ